MVSEEGIEPSPHVPKTRTLPLRHSEIITWCPYTESNCKLRITKPSLYHLTIRAHYSYSALLRYVDSNHASRINSPPPSPRLLYRSNALYMDLNFYKLQLETSSFGLVIYISSWITHNTCATNHIVKLMMSVTMSPQFDLWMV